jgi:hypothetical protein
MGTLLSISCHVFYVNKEIVKDSLEYAKRADTKKDRAAMTLPLKILL